MVQEPGMHLTSGNGQEVSNALTEAEKKQLRSGSHYKKLLSDYVQDVLIKGIPVEKITEQRWFEIETKLFGNKRLTPNEVAQTHLFLEDTARQDAQNLLFTEYTVQERERVYAQLVAAADTELEAFFARHRGDFLNYDKLEDEDGPSLYTDLNEYTDRYAAAAAMVAFIDHLESAHDSRAAKLRAIVSGVPVSPEKEGRSAPESAGYETEKVASRSERELSVGAPLRLWVGVDAAGRPVLPQYELLKKETKSRSKKKSDEVAVAYSCPELSRFVLPKHSHYFAFEVVSSELVTEQGAPTMRVELAFSRNVFNTGDQIKPAAYQIMKQSPSYVLGDGAVVAIPQEVLTRIDRATGHLLNEQGADAGTFPIITLGVKDPKSRAFAVEIASEHETRLRDTLDEVVYQYLVRADLGSQWDDVPIANLSPSEQRLRKADIDAMVRKLGAAKSVDFGMDPLAQQFSNKEREAIVAKVRQQSERFPLAVVVSARERQLSWAFSQLITEWKPHPKYPKQGIELKRAGKAGQAAFNVLIAAGRGDETDAAKIEQARREYVDFFYRLEHYRELTGENVREQLFRSDLDGETSAQMFEQAGLHIVTVPFVPNQKQETVEYIEHASHLDITHDEGMSFPQVRVPESEHARRAILIDEDGADIKSAASASYEFLRRMGFMRQNERFETIAQFIDAYDNFLGPYASPEGRNQIFEHFYHQQPDGTVTMNLYGMIDLLINRREIRLLQDLIIEARKELGPDFLDKLITYDASKLLHARISAEAARIKDPKAPHPMRDLFEKIQQTQQERIQKAREGIQVLEELGFVADNTPYGRLLVDPYGAVNADMRLSVFAAGFDGYVGFNPEGRVGTVNVSGFYKRPDGTPAVMPPDFLQGAGAQRKGDVVKYGRLFVMNSSSEKLTGFQELWSAVYDGAAPQATPEAIAQLMDLDGKEQSTVSREYQQMRAGFERLREGLIGHFSEEGYQVIGEEDIGGTIPPPPDTRRFERELAFEVADIRLWPESLSDSEAHFILDLANHREKIHCYKTRRELTDAEQLDWDSVAQGWWRTLSVDQRKQFVAGAHRMNVAQSQEQLVEVRPEEGQYKMFWHHLRRSQPSRLRDYLAAVHEGRDVPAPAGFDERAWNRFLKEEWYEGMEPAQRLAFAEDLMRHVRIEGKRRKAEQQLAAAEAQLAQAEQRVGGGFFGKLLPIKSKKEVAALQAEIRELKSKIIDCKSELFGLSATQHVNNLLDAAHTRLKDAQRQHGLLHGVVESVASGRGAKVAIPEERIMAALVDTQGIKRGVQLDPLMRSVVEHVQAAYEEDPEESGRLRVREFNERELQRLVVLRASKAEQPSPLAYYNAIQQEVTRALAHLSINGVALEEAVKKPPLNNLLKEYRSALEAVAAEESGPTITAVNDFYRQQIAEAQRQVFMRVRGADTSRAFNAATRGAVQQLLENTLGQVYQGYDIPEVAHHESIEPGPYVREEVVGPRDQMVDVIDRIIAQYHDHMKPQERAYLAQQFLTKGSVSDSGGIFGQHIIEKGRLTGTLFIGDRVRAVHDPKEMPFGFRIEVVRGAGVKNPGYFEYDENGLPMRYYERLSDKHVKVWTFDDNQDPHFAGEYRGNQYVPHEERAWRYTYRGHDRVISEHQKNVFFKPNGTVVILRQDVHHPERMTAQEIGSTGELPRVLRVIRPDDVEVDLDTTRAEYYISPRGAVFVNDRLLGLREIGTFAGTKEVGAGGTEPPEDGDMEMPVWPETNSSSPVIGARPFGTRLPQIKKKPDVEYRPVPGGLDVPGFEKPPRKPGK